MAQIASVSFAGANGTLLEAYTNVSDLGLALAKHLYTTGAMEIQSAVAVLSAGQASGTRAHYLASGSVSGGVPTTPEYDVALDIEWLDTTQIPGLLLRSSQSTTETYLIYYGTNGWQAAKFDNASTPVLTNIGSPAAWSPNPGQRYTVLGQVRNIGTGGKPVFLLFIDGVPLALNGAEDASPSTVLQNVGRSGLHVRQQTGTSQAYAANTGVRIHALSAADGAGLYAGLQSGGPYTLSGTQLPLSALAGRTVYIHGAGAHWLTAAPSLVLHNSQGGTNTNASISGGSLVVIDDTNARVDIIAGTAPGTLSLEDQTIGQSVTLFVIATPIIEDHFNNATGSAIFLDSGTYHPTTPSDANWIAQPGGNTAAGSAIITTAGQVRADAVGRTHYLLRGTGGPPDSAQPGTPNEDYYTVINSPTGGADYPGFLLRASTTDPSGYIVYYSYTLHGWILGRYETNGSLTNNLGSAVATLPSGRVNVHLHIETDPNTNKVTVQLYTGTGGVFGSTPVLTASDDPLDRSGQILTTGHVGYHWNVQAGVAPGDGTVTAFDDLYLYAAPTLSLSPAQITAGTTGNVITGTGGGTAWTPSNIGDPDGSPDFVVSGGGAGAGKTAQNVTSPSTVLLTIDAGATAPADLSVVDPTTGVTAILSVVPEIVSILPTDPNWYFSPGNWRSNGGGARGANNVKAGSTAVSAVNCGAYSMTVFGGTTLKLLVSGAVANGMAIAWTIDEGPLRIHPLTSQDNTNGIILTVNDAGVATPLADGQHTLLLYVYSIVGSMDRWNVPTQILTITGLQLDTGKTLSAPTIQPGILYVFGDSLTEGISSISTGAMNAYFSFAFSVAQALAAEVGVIGWGNTGWACSNAVGGGSANIPAFYTPNSDLASSWNKYYAGQSRLVGGKFDPMPGMIIGNDGRNDARVGIPDATVRASVAGFLADARAACNPTTPIVITIPFSGAKRAAITQAVTDYQTATADPYVYLIDLGTAIQAGINGNLTDEATHIFTPTGPTEKSPDGSHLYAHTAGRLGALLAHAIQQATGQISIGRQVLTRGR